MLLQQIVEMLDVELTRLEALRALVSGLSGSVEFSFHGPAGEGTAEEATSESLPPETPQVSAPPPVTRVKNARRPYTKRAKKPVPEAKALASRIPTGPVVVSPAVLAKEGAAKREGRAAAKPSEPKQEIGTLGSMIRALRLDASA